VRIPLKPIGRCALMPITGSARMPITLAA